MNEAERLLRENSIDELLEMAGVKDNVQEDTRVIISKREIEHRLELDIVPALKGKYRTQDKWIKYWNKTKDDKWFPSASELYQVFKQIVDRPDRYSSLLTLLKEDFDKKWLLSSTRIQYNADNPMARIIHNYNSDRQQEPIALDIPSYSPGEPLIDVLNDKDGFDFFKALLSTEDCKEDILETFSAISGRNWENIKVWTPPFLRIDNYITRSDYPERAVSFGYLSDGFHILCNYYLSYDGRSRGVRL